MNIFSKESIGTKKVAWLMFFVVTIFYFFDVMSRMMPAVMTDTLFSVLHVDATQLGFVTSFYYLAYTPMQVPAGMVLDRFSIKNVLVFASFVCTTSLIVFHLTNNLYVASAARFCIGFACSFGYIAALKTASIWLPQRYFGRLSCLTDSIGMIAGAVLMRYMLPLNNKSSFLQKAYPYLRTHSSFNFVATIVVFVGLIVLALSVFVLRDKPKELRHNYEDREFSLYPLYLKLKRICSSSQLWLIGIVGCLTYLPASVIGDVWGVPYLETVYHLSSKNAGVIMTAFFLGWVIAGPFVGWISDSIRSRTKPILFCSIIAVSLFMIMIMLPWMMNYLLPVGALIGVFFVLGVTMSPHPLVFALAKENFSLKMSATVIGVTNMMTMLGGNIFQPLFGYIMDYRLKYVRHIAVKYAHAHVPGAARYTAADYQTAMLIVPIMLAIGLIFIIMLKDTHPEADEA